VRLDRTFSSMNPDFRTSITLEHTGELDIEPYTTTVISAPNTEPDEYSPEFQAYPTFEVDFVEDEPGSCVPGGWRVTLRFPPAVDDWGVLAYSLGADGDDGPRQLLSRLAPLDPNAEVTMVHYAGYTPRLICYALTAYDMGGNIAFLAEPRLCVTVGGDADAGVPRTDAGFEDAGFEDAGSSDAGRVDAATTPPGLALTGRSCACRGTASPSDLGGLGALLLLALAARRRR